jgi:hypothetical protein
MNIPGFFKVNIIVYIENIMLLKFEALKNRGAIFIVRVGKVSGYFL